MSRSYWKYVSVLVGLMVSMPMVRAEATLPSVLADHMVIQRDKPVHVWGSADPGEQVTVSFRGHQGTSIANDLGRWSLYLPPVDAGGPFTLTIQKKYHHIHRRIGR